MSSDQKRCGSWSMELGSWCNGRQLGDAYSRLVKADSLDFRHIIQ